MVARTDHCEREEVNFELIPIITIQAIFEFSKLQPVTTVFTETDWASSDPVEKYSKIVLIFSTKFLHLEVKFFKSNFIFF